MKLKSILLSAALISTSATVEAGTNWFEVAGKAINAAIDIKQGNVDKAVNRFAKPYVTPEQYEADPDRYADWIYVERKRNIFSPEYYDQWCSYPIRANVIQIDASEFPKGCPKYLAVHPNEAY